MRQATLDDIPGLTKLWYYAKEETVYKPTKISDDKLRSMYTDIINQNNFCCVIERDGDIVGNMIARMSGDFYTDENVATVTAFYIRPEFRGGKKVAHMIMNYIAWAKENGAVQIKAGISSGNLSSHRLYNRLGFETVGYQYLYKEV